MCNVQYVQSPELGIAHCSFSILGRRHALVQGFNARNFSVNSLPEEVLGVSLELGAWNFVAFATAAVRWLRLCRFAFSVFFAVNRTRLL
jgi:hypothetical protein